MSRKRNYGIDILRLLCVITIFYFHVLTNLKCDFGIMGGYFRVGAICMTGFFMLSGYILFDNYRQINLIEINNLKTFYKKRFVALMPMYFIVCILWYIFLNDETIVNNLLLLPIEFSGTQMFYNGLFHFIHNGGTWFVSCFIFAYLFFPMSSAVIKQLKNKELLIMYVIISLFLLYAPLFVWLLKIDSIYSNPIFRFLEFILGIILAKYNGKIFDLRKPGFVFFLSIIFMIIACSLAVYLDIAPWNYSLYIWIGLPCFSIALLLSKKIYIKNIRIQKLLGFTSNIAYDFFLVSFFTWPLTEWISVVTGNYENFFRILSATLINCILCVIAYFFIERKLRIILCKFLKL